MLYLGNAKQRKTEIKCSVGLLHWLCERETRQEELTYARKLIRKYGSLDKALVQVELERLKPGGRLDIDGNSVRLAEISKQ